MADVRIVIGTSNDHKVREISQILSAIPAISLVPFSDYEPIPEIDEDGATFSENAGKKAHLLAQYLYARRGASRSGRHTAVTNYDEDGEETDMLENLAAERAREQAEDMLGLNRQGTQGSRRLFGSESQRIKPADILVLADDSGLEVDMLGGAPGVHSARYAGEHGNDTANTRKLLSELKDVPEEKRTARFVCSIALATQKEVLLTVEGKVEGLIVSQPKGENGFGYDPVFYFPPYGQTFGETSAEGKNAVSHRANALKMFKSRLMRLLTDEGLA